MGAQDGPSIVSLEFEVFGQVQGVYFTKYCRDMCQQLGIGGWVKNSKTGTIVGKMQGDRGQVDKMQKLREREGKDVTFRLIQVLWTRELLRRLPVPFLTRSTSKDDRRGRLWSKVKK